MLNIVNNNNKFVHGELFRMTNWEGFRMHRPKRLDIIPTVPLTLIWTTLVIGPRQPYMVCLRVLFLYWICVMKIVAYADLCSVSCRYKIKIVDMRFELIYSRMQSRNAAHSTRKLCDMVVAKSAQWRIEAPCVCISHSANPIHTIRVCWKHFKGHN